MTAEQVAKLQTEKQSDRAADWKKELRQIAAESEHHIRQSTHHLRTRKDGQRAS
jgi:hypothetical protein